MTNNKIKKSFRDPSSFIIESNNQILRAIEKQKKNFYENLFKEKWYQNLVNDKKIQSSEWIKMMLLT